jgi:ribosome maturation factor RimP
MKEQIKELVDSKIKELNVFVDDAFVEKNEGKDVLYIVLDSEEVIDLDKITESSRIINEILDKQEKLLDDIYEVDIYSKEKGGEDE